MPISPEERARIARENGAKSRGPVTPEGKDRSRLNSLKDGRHATTIAHLVPTDNAVVLFEDRRAYARFVQELLAQYQPVNKLALSVVLDIAVTQWQIDRLRNVIITHWNLAIGAEHAKPTELDPEIRQLTAVAGAAQHLLGGSKFLAQANREIARLETSIIRLERRLKFIHANFTAPAPVVDASADEERTEPETEAEIGNTELGDGEPVGESSSDFDNEPEDEPNAEPVVLVDPPTDVIDRARREFPDRPIVILPAHPDEELPNAA
jgi:hypothetical protein